MDGSLIYAKTPKGVAEVAARSPDLPMVARRVLIMMDGKRTLGELAMLVRPGEIEAIVTQLESAGLAERTGAAGAPVALGGRATVVPAAPPAGPATTTSITAATVTVAPTTAPAAPVTVAPAPSPEPDLAPITLDEAKRRAVRELTDRLGPEADRVAIRIESCRSVEEFRERVREAERYVAMALGAAAAQDYVRALRRRP
jgi:hypothetical protein